MTLDKRLRELEEEDKPRKIRSWLDLVKFAQQKEEKTIKFDREWAEFIKRVLQDLDRSDKRSALSYLGQIECQSCGGLSQIVNHESSAEKQRFWIHNLHSAII